MANKLRPDETHLLLRPEFDNRHIEGTDQVIPGHFGFAISVCRLRERGRMSKSVYVRMFHDLE